MKTTVEAMPRYEIAFMRNTGPYEPNNVQTMEKLKAWAKEENMLKHDSIILGIAHDDPSASKAEDCRYDACIVISDEYIIDEEYLHRGEIAGGEYLIFEIEHTADAVQKAWADILNELRESIYSMDYSRPVIERYSGKMIASHKCEICIPICR